MKRLFVFGLGYTASHIASALRARGWAVDATGCAGNIDFADDAAVAKALAGASHVVSSVPPANDSDPVLDRYAPDRCLPQHLALLDSLVR